MSDPKTAEAPPPAKLYPHDFDLIAKLLPRAQITVADVPNILGTLQRLQTALATKASFTEDRPSGEPEKG